MDMALLIIWNLNGLFKSDSVSGIFSLHAGPIYSTGNLRKLPFLPIFNVFKYILCRMDMALLIIRNLNGMLNSGAVSGIFSLHAGPIYSTGNLRKLPFLPVFNVFKYVSGRLDMALIVFRMPDV